MNHIVCKLSMIQFDNVLILISATWVGISLLVQGNCSDEAARAPATHQPDTWLSLPGQDSPPRLAPLTFSWKSSCTFG